MDIQGSRISSERRNKTALMWESTSTCRAPPLSCRTTPTATVISQKRVTPKMPGSTVPPRWRCLRMGRSSSPTWETSASGRFSKIDRLPVCVKPTKKRIDTCTVSASPPLLVPPGSLPSGLGSYEVACPSSQELYVFDVNGTHQFTMSLVTGDYMYNFSYRLVGGQRSSITRI